MTRVKICGITNLADARTAIRAGADALGFVFAKSPRQIKVAEAIDLSRALGPFVTRVGVFANAPYWQVKRIAEECALDVVQLHGDESTLMVQKLRREFRVIKSFRVATAYDLRPVRDYDADAYLFDTKVDGVYGGTGVTLPWEILKQVKFERPVILAGGLNSRNVGEVIRLLRPYGVDVSSGVEKSPGVKDPKLLREFVINAKKDGI